VRPVRIEVMPLMLSKQQPWYWVPPAPGHWQIEVGEPIAPAAVAAFGSTPALAARRLTLHFYERLARDLTASAPV
jgi:hypothetical protein